uniref:NAD-dependent epimerase/dehydratase domain-containing protein n=1 Tax=Pyrodinium bahamense TaxID=73915 RepID=A0A7S0A367_9DINO
MCGGGGELVCVTGANGYLAAHIVRDLLARGHRVRGTVRSQRSEERLAPLRAFAGAEERLELVEADMTAPESFPEMLRGVGTLVHTACPNGKPPVSTFEEAQETQLAPAVDGTRSLLEAAEHAGVRKVVLTASIGSMQVSPTFPEVLDESCWTDEDFCREKLLTSASACYALSKTMQEREAWRIAGRSSFRLVVINPGLIVGPSLMLHLNYSLGILLNLASGQGTGLNVCRPGTLPDAYKGWVDVREVSEAHVLAVESEEAEGRYLLQSSVTHYEDIYAMMRKHPAMAHHPERPLDVEGGTRRSAAYAMDNSKMRALGVRPVPIEKSMLDTVETLAANGLVELPAYLGA